MTKKNKETKTSKPLGQVAIEEQNNTLLAWVCVATITVITWLVFSPSLNNGFTNWDDNDYVTGNSLVVTNTVPAIKIFETPVSANYHPLTVLSLALNYQNGKLNPIGYHLVNVIFHLFNTILAFLFIFLLTRRNLLMAAVVSLFFGIHPMHVESVAWVSERKDVLYVFFFMTGLITYLNYIDTKKMKWYWFTFLMFILSCLSKGMAVVFPVILLLVDYLKGVKRERRSLTEKIPFFLIAIVFGIIAVKIQVLNIAEFKMRPAIAISVINNFTFLQRLMFSSYGAVLYIVKFFMPFKLSAFYQYPGVNSSNGIPLVYYISPVILLGVLAAAGYCFLKKEKEIVFGSLFYFVSVAPVLQFISVGRAIMADRYSYLSYIGLLFVAAYLINKLWTWFRLNKNGKWTSLKYPFMVILVIAAILFSYQSYSRTQVWKNGEVLWTDAINNYPNSSIAYFNRANYYLDSNELDKAIADYTEAIKIDPTFVLAYNDRGMAHYKNNDRPELEIADYNKAIALDSTYADAYSNRGTAYYKNFKDDPALNDLNKAIELDSTFAPYYYNLGLEYKATNKYEKAITDFTKGIRLNPAHIELYYNVRGMCKLSLEDYTEAITDFSKAIEANPSLPAYWLNRSFAENKTGQVEAANADALEAQRLQRK